MPGKLWFGKNGWHFSGEAIMSRSFAAGLDWQMKKIKK
jgi:hypothetical protein